MWPKTGALDQKGAPPIAKRVRDKTALVTGATNTIGGAIVTAFAAEAHRLSSEAVAGSAAVDLTRAGAV
jgi:NAD(P)-dependent dehydrogenase (short-subunit alcohol dehydrogenase family)